MSRKIKEFKAQIIQANNLTSTEMLETVVIAVFSHRALINVIFP